MVDLGTHMNDGRLLTNFTNWNVKGLNHPIKRTRILTHRKHLKTDIAFLTETHMLSLDHVSLRRG